MTETQITTSAALYFACEERESVPLRWFDKAREFFAEHALSPILFLADGAGFVVDECYVLADRGADIVDDEGCVLAARGGDLIRALRSGTVKSLGLDSPRSISTGRSDWRAMVDVSLNDGVLYLGLDDDLICDTTTVLRHAYEIMEGLFDVRYGIAYKSPLAEEPDCYASGYARYSLSETVEMIRSRGEWDYRQRSSDEFWRDELDGRRRHLTGLFRGAYPASVLSESHVEMAGLRLRNVGELSELDRALWLWELSESEMPVAQRMLEDRNALISNVDDKMCDGPANSE